MKTIVVDPLFPLSWIIPVAVLVVCLLGWLEIRRHQKLLALRLLALLVSVLSITGLIVNPSVPVSKSSDIILLTPGYNPKALDSLLNAHSKSRVYKLHAVNGNNGAIEILNYRDLSDLRGNLFVLGEGLPGYMLEYMDTASLRYFSFTDLPGVTGINTTKIYTADKRAALEGVATFHANRTISLSGPAGQEDSVQVTGTKTNPFTVNFLPKVSGLFVYTLSVSDTLGKETYSEPVPVQVEEQKPLSILFLSDYPSAEVRFLKNFLEKRNHRLILRYKVSKDKYRTEFINTKQQTIGLLNEDLLQHIDLVLTDAVSVGSLSNRELAALKEAMKSGLGLLTLINTTTIPKQATEFLTVTANKIKSDSAELLLHTQRIKIPATPLSLTSTKNINTVQRELSGRIVSGYFQTGLGKSGFQLLANTFSLELAGQKDAYAEIWSPLIEAVARKEIKKYDVRFTTAFPYYPDEPVEFKIIAGAEKPRVTFDSTEISLVEDPLVKNVWYGKIWAGSVGWNSLTIHQDSSQHNFFVSQPGAWRSMRVLNQQRGMRNLLSQQEQIREQIVLLPVSKIIFFLLFLLSAGFLWVAPKL